MQVHSIPLISTGQVNTLAKDYLSNLPPLSEYYAFSPSIEGMKEAIRSRREHHVNRGLLAEKLFAQYQQMNAGFNNDAANGKVASNIELLIQENTFTITTGHQLNIFTGPLYFIYKIVSAISYAEQLKKEFPECNFIPVYWMASEDHDFAEINHIHLFGKELKWDTEEGGAVGRMAPGGTEDKGQGTENDTLSGSPFRGLGGGGILTELEELISRQDKGKHLMEIFSKAYSQPTLALATRYILHELFKNDGLLILDADDADLKRSLIPVLKEDILNNSIYEKVSATKKQLEEKYEVPVNPREINVFYLSENKRTRITRDENIFKADGIKQWEEHELILELESEPQNFSPNVVLRPMYQEIILPNLCYIGGNNEIAYWLELKSVFDAQNIFFPQLLIRDSALWIGKRFAKDMDTFKLSTEDLFQPLPELKKSFYAKNVSRHAAEDTLDTLLLQYETLKTDVQKLPSDIAAQIVKQSNEHQKELKRLTKEIQRKKDEENEKSLVKLEKLYLSVFPENDFQERYDNFIPYYLQYGENFFTLLKENFNPLKGELKVFMDA